MIFSARYGGSSSDWDWGLGATVGTAVGTTLLATATFLLAYGVRRPRLSLRAGDDFHVHSRVEGDAQAYLRLLVWNDRGKRSATDTRVLVHGYRDRDAVADQLTTIGSPSLGWPSATEAVDESVVIFGGSGRPLDFGRLQRVKLTDSGVREVAVGSRPDGTTYVYIESYPLDPDAVWHFRPGIGLNIADQHEWLPPGRWTVQLIVGADEADAHYYDVDLDWDGQAATPQAALDSVTLTIRASG